MEDAKKGYEIKQKNNYLIVIDIINNNLIIECDNKTTGVYFVSKNYTLEDLKTMNKYFRNINNIKDIQTILNTTIEKAKIGLLEDFNQITIFFI